MTRFTTQLAYVCLGAFRAMQRDLGVIVAFFLIFPLGFLFFLDQLVVASLRPQILVGAIMMEAALININVLPQSIAHDRSTHFFDLWVSLPISPATYVMGTALPWLPVSVATASATLAMGVLVFQIPVVISPLLVLLALVLVWSSTAGIGFLVAVYGGKPRQVNQLSGFMGIIMTFFAPIFYPISVLPPALQDVAYVWPLTWGAILLRDLLNSNFAQATVAGAVLVLYSVVGIALMALGLRWRQP